MFKKLLPFIVLGLLWCAPAHAQNTTCATRPPGDNSNACASTAFVQSALPVVPVVPACTNLLNSPGNVLTCVSALANGITATTQSLGDNTTKIATDAFVQAAATNAAQGAQGYVDPRQAPYNAAADCVTDDTSAISAASTAALASGQAVIISTCYAVNTTASWGTPFVFTSGGYLNVGGSATPTLSARNIVAPSMAYIFRGTNGTKVVLSNVVWDSVAWWGAVVAVDSAPAINAAMGSNRTIYFPPGVSYYLASYVNACIGTSTICASTNVYIKNLSNWTISAYGATFIENATAAAGGGCACMFYMDENVNFNWLGGTFFGQKSTIPASPAATLTGLVNHNAQNFLIKDLNFTGNFGMTYNANCSTGGGVCGTGITGEYEANGKYENIYMMAVNGGAGVMGLGFDMAFTNNVTYDNIQGYGANGSGLSGNNQWGYSLISYIYDSVIATCAGGGVCNTTGYAFTTSTNTTFHMIGAQNFAYAINITDGAVYHLSDSWIVGANATAPIAGMYFAWANLGTVPQQFTVTNTVISGYQRGVYMVTSGISTPFTKFQFDNDVVQGNTNGFDTDDTTGTKITNFTVGPSVGLFSNSFNFSANALLSMTVGANCGAGVSATTGRSVNGMLTHC